MISGIPLSPNGKDVLAPATRSDWRGWLGSNPDRREDLWVVCRKKSSSLQGPVDDDLVEEALCFGWIDSRVRRVDDDRVIQWYSPRREGGLWSAVNKARMTTTRTRRIQPAQTAQNSTVVGIRPNLAVRMCAGMGR